MDSSKFATHLRLIQFMILITSAALVMAALEAPSGAISRAHTDLVRIAHLARSWTSGDLGKWMHDAFPGEFQPRALLRRGALFDLTIPPAFYEATVGSAYPEFAMDSVHREKDQRQDRSPTRIVTLTDFRRLWDLGEDLTAFRLREIVDAEGGASAVALYDLDSQKLENLDDDGVVSAGPVHISEDGAKVRVVAVSNNGQRVLRHWSIQSGRALERPSATLRLGGYCALSPDGRSLLTNVPYVLRVDDLKSGTTLELQGYCGYEFGAFSNQGDFFLHRVHGDNFLHRQLGVQNVTCVHSTKTLSQSWSTHGLPEPMAIALWSRMGKIRPDVRRETSRPTEWPYHITVLSRHGGGLSLVSLDQGRIDVSPVVAPIGSNTPPGPPYLVWQIDAVPLVVVVAAFSNSGSIILGGRNGSLFVGKPDGSSNIGIPTYGEFQPLFKNELLGAARKIICSRSSDHVAATFDHGVVVLSESSPNEAKVLPIEAPNEIAFSPDGGHLAITQGGLVSERCFAKAEVIQDPPLEKQHGVAAQGRLTWSDSNGQQYSTAARFDIARIPLRDYLRSSTDRHGTPAGWAIRPFNIAFRSLSEVTANIQDVPLDHLEEHVATLLDSGGESLEVVGLTMPARFIRRCGTLILLVLLGYFALHARAFPRSLSSGDPAWEVPWLAFYSGRLARAAMAFSLCLAPTVAATMLTWKSWRAVVDGTTGSWLELVLNCAGIASVVILSWFCLRESGRLALQRLPENQS